MGNTSSTIVKKLLFLLGFLFTTAPFSCLAASPLDVVINEMCWMGTETSANDEWIELYNNQSEEVDLTNWKLTSLDGTPEIDLSGKIAANGFFILERTDDDTIADIQADQIYKGALGNQGELLQLIDAQGKIIDKIDCSPPTIKLVEGKSSWFEGDNITKQTMERISPKHEGSIPNNWQLSQLPGGTPKTINSNGDKTERETTISTEQPTQDIDKKTYPSGIVINEILASPEGSDLDNEYIEIFNQNSFKVDISGWLMQDIEGATNVFVFPEETLIETKGFMAFFRPRTKISLNNSGDGLKLQNPNHELVDEISFEKALQGKSLNRIGEEFVWSSDLTPGTENSVNKETSKEIAGQEKNNKPLEDTSGLVSSGEKSLESPFYLSLEATSGIKNLKNFFAVFLVALSMAVFSGISILLLKRKNRNPR